MFFCSGSCGGEFTDAYGHMSSPSYPNNYPANADCIYKISQPNGTVILLTFLRLDIDKSEFDNCQPDHLEIRDGFDSIGDDLSDDPLFLWPHLGDSPFLCGSEIPAPIQSSRNKLWIK